MSWSSWQPSKEQPWDWRRVIHLWRRAGFAPDWGMIQTSLREGYEATLQRVLNPDPTKRQPFEELAETIGEAAVGADSAERLRAWWVYRMLMTPFPLEERMTLLWHNHFATSNLKVQDVALMHEQNHLLRKHSLGKFDQLLQSVVKHPAMLKWLDADSNRKEHPNENLARELLELFTLGEGHFGEQDVVEAARCLTGWTIDERKFRFNEKTHDEGVKSVLGVSGKMNGSQLLDFLLKQRATANRIAGRLCQLFFGEGAIEANAHESLAEQLSENGLDLGAAVETILRSEYFHADKNFGCRIAGPSEYIIGTLRALEVQERPPSTLLLAEQFRRLGQDLFHPPSVFGWGEGRQWINTRTVLARQAFARQLVAGGLYQNRHPFDLNRLPQRHSQFGNDFYSQLLLGKQNLHVGDDEEQLVRLICDPETQLV